MLYKIQRLTKVRLPNHERDFSMELTCPERHLKRLMQVWALLFGFGAVLFLFAGNLILMGGNWISAYFLHLKNPLMPMPSEHFWLALTTSMMVTITAIAYHIQRDVVTNKGLTSLLLISKFTSTLVFLGMYFFDAPYFNYLLGSIFCDGPIFLITLFFYRRAIRGCGPCPASSPTSGY